MTSSSGTSSDRRRPRPLERHEARQDLRRDLHPREHRLVAERVAHEHGEAEGQVGDVGERPPGRDSERRQCGEDRLLEMPGQLRALLVVELGDADDRGCPRRPAPAAAPFEAVGQAGALGEHPLADQGDRLRGRVAVLRRRLHACVDLVAQAGHPDHVELIEVGGVDRAELHPLEQRHPLVLGELQDAVVEVKPGELAVQVQRGVVVVLRGRRLPGRAPRPRAAR